MQLLICHKVKGKLVLPLSYHYILQGIIYNSVNTAYGYGEYLHNQGANYGQRSYKLFTFSLIRGKYRIKDRQIVFYENVEFEVSSNDAFLIRTVGDFIRCNGISYGEQHYDDVEVYYSDSTIESTEVVVQMISPITVYSSDANSGKTYYYAPYDEEFEVMINDNLKRKYAACYGVMPQSDIAVDVVQVTEKDKYVTKYKGGYITGWKGVYRLQGERKYLDFLYQTGLGSKNSQGFGMFEVIEM